MLHFKQPPNISCLKQLRFLSSQSTCPIWAPRARDEGLYLTFIISQFPWVRSSEVTQLGNSGPGDAVI